MQLHSIHIDILYSGELKIAEVVSRFSDLDTFITLLESLGFEFIDKVIQKHTERMEILIFIL
jgi:hypothetical protein